MDVHTVYEVTYIRSIVNAVFFSMYVYTLHTTMQRCTVVHTMLYVCTYTVLYCVCVCVCVCACIHMYAVHSYECMVWTH